MTACLWFCAITAVYFRLQVSHFGNIRFFLNSQKFRKNSSEISLGQNPVSEKQGFPNIPNLRNIWNLLYSELSENYENMTLKLNFENCKKLVPTQIPTRTFEFKFGMQGLTSDATLLSLASVYRWYSCTCIAFVRRDCILLEVQYLQRQTRDILTYSYDTPFKFIVFCYIFEVSITVIFPF